MEYAHQKKVSLPFQEAVEKVRKELAKEGFGVITEIDAQAVLREKLNVSFDNYVILGACNPKFAYQALQIDKEAGLFLPCNIIIYECMKDIFICAIRPVAAMSALQNNKLSAVAEEVDKKLKKVIEQI